MQQGELACRIKPLRSQVPSGSPSPPPPATLQSLGGVPISQSEELRPGLEPGDPWGSLLWGH